MKGQERGVPPASVLAVDDEPRLLSSLEALLLSRGYRVQTAAGGHEACAWLERQRFDLVLADLMMPEVDGFEVMRYVQEKGHDSPVIVVSGDSSIESAIGALRAGAHDFVRKPYAPEVLLKTVENAMRQRRLERDAQQMEARLRRSEQLYRYMVNNSPDIIYMLDGQGRFRFVNDRAEQLLGYEREELVGRHFSEVLAHEDQDLARYAFAERRTGGRRSRNVELHLRCKAEDADPLVVENSFIPIELDAWGLYSPDNGEGRRFMGTYGVARDISGRKRAEETIRFQAHHDLLTRLPNRTLLKDRLGLALADARRHGDGLAVLHLDIDRFKIINDHLGHAMGDELLCAFAERLRASLRDDDTLARIGGDEFAVLLPHVRGEQEVARVGAKIRDTLATPFMIGGQEVFTSVSVGAALFPHHGESIDGLLRNADVAMYHSRSSGHAGFACYEPSMDDTFSRHLAIERGIRTGLGSDQFSVHFQAQVDADSERIVGFEALARWEHPELGSISPQEFVPVAEKTGLIVPLGDWVVAQACEAVARWRAAGFTDLRIAVNFSTVQVAQVDFVDKIFATLERFGLPGRALELEITENVLMNDMDTVASKLRTLSSRGVTVAIDDFGTGYSSLSYLQSLPIDRIKIDRSFVCGLSDETRSSGIVTAIVAMASGLDVSVVAEGVESRSQCRFLRGIGCRELQGFLFSRPLPPAEVAGLLGAGVAFG